MFKKKQPAISAAKKLESGEIDIKTAQNMLNVRHLEAQVVQVEETARDQTNLVDLRKSWGKVILGVLIATIVSDFILIGMVGTNTWTFTNNTYFLNVIVTEHLIQIFGLVLIVLKSLFPKGSK